MTKETVNLSLKTAKLKTVVLNQTCNDCSLMGSYITNEYQQLCSKYEAIDKLVKSNFIQQQTYIIDEIKHSISILGLYILV